MTLQNTTEVINFVKDSMGDTSSAVSDAAMTNAAAQALKELHWTLPITDDSKEYWIIERTKRYVIYTLLIDSAHKFQFKKMYLQHRFQHYIQLIKMMDAEFQKSLENEPNLFDVGTYPNLTFYITNGFEYNELGEDASYPELTQY